MARRIEDRLQNLKMRRQGPPSFVKSTTSAFGREGTTATEIYETRTTDKATRYALGAMQSVDPSYTKNSYVEGDRVKNQLEKGLEGDIAVSFEYQGSVPLDVHIKGVSDIDLLVLRSDLVTVDLTGARHQAGHYSEWYGLPAPQALAHLRQRSYNVLVAAFPEVQVDSSGAKSLTLTGGSLRRKVDVVPAHWHDSDDYQQSIKKKDRGVKILDNKLGITLHNHPFLHMHLINEKDLLTNGGTKKAIRLLKNLKEDSENGQKIALSSYDIAGLVWNMDRNALTVSNWTELSIIATIRNAFATLISQKSYCMSLKTPDGSRCIIDSESKYSSLLMLFLELITLAKEVAQEITGGIAVSDDLIEKKLRGAFVL